MTPAKLLIVDDEPDYLDALSALFGDDYEVHTARSGAEALESIEAVVPDLIVLDVMMPGMDGFQACHRLRQRESTRRTPIIFLTSKGEAEAETFGLDLGADDYVRKPFDKEVLRARVKRRLTAAGGLLDGEVTNLDGYKVYWERQEVLAGDQVIPLTTKEAGLLRLLVQNKGRVLSRDAILERVWSERYITDRTIDSHIKELRKKIPPLVKLLKTVYGAGYRLDL